MNAFIHLFRFIFRIRYWLIILPIVVAVLVYFKMGNVNRMYTVRTTIYTGIVSGYDINTVDGVKQDWNVINNAMDNLINIITSQSTLRRVSMRLYAQALVYGDAEKDNNYIKARSYRNLLAHTPKEVLDLADRSSEQITLARLYAYERPDPKNHVYGLFNWYHPHYSYSALKNIVVRRANNSDMLEISYTNDDPCITYQTLVLLNEEFVNEYKNLRFGETNNVIDYFREQLRKVGDELRMSEDSLTQYNVKNKVINYGEQTKHIAALSRDFELNYQDILLNRDGAVSVINTIENRVESLKTFKNNAEFVKLLRDVSNTYAKMATTQVFESDTNIEKDDDKPKFRRRATEEVTKSQNLEKQATLDVLQSQLDNQKDELSKVIANISAEQYTKEGMSVKSMIQQWLESLLLLQKSNAEIAVMNERKKDLDQQYVVFSPIGTTLKRKERSINFLEQSYLSYLDALNAALMRQKSLQMTSATLKIINPPTMPLSAEPSKRKMMVFGSFIATFLFVLGFFILLELLDRTLRDKLRAERIIGGTVLGAFPAEGKFRERAYSQTYQNIATQYLANAVLNYFKPNTTNIVNFVSVDDGEGKSLVARQLAEHLRATGMKVRVLSCGEDFTQDDKRFLLAAQLSDFVVDKQGEVPLSEADVVLVEYPALAKCSVPSSLLQAAALNLLFVRANRVWRDKDETYYAKLQELKAQTPLAIFLTFAKREAVEEFTGLMPPQTIMRKFLYRIEQFGFTSSSK